MKITKRFIVSAAAIITLAGPTLIATGAHAVDATTANNAGTSPMTDKGSDRIANIKNRGDAEIARRLTSLNNVINKIASAQKITAGDKTALTNEVNTEISGLTALKTKLDGETTLAGAIADAQSIITEYRVYALVVPKIALIRAADDQQAVEAKLTALASKLQTRLNTEKANGTDITALQAKLDDMVAKTNQAQGISSSVEQKVLPLQPTDFNSDHTILGGYRDQLQTAHADNQAAYNDAKSIVTGLK